MASDVDYKTIDLSTIEPVVIDDAYLRGEIEMCEKAIAGFPPDTDDYQRTFVEALLTVYSEQLKQYELGSKVQLDE